jgi:hypothetical protein
MPIITTEIRSPSLGHSIEATISADSYEKNAATLSLDVPAGSPALIVTVSDDDDYFSDRAPTNVDVYLKPPENSEYKPQRIISAGGTVIFAIQKPESGRWTITVEYTPGASARVNASAYGEDFWKRLQGFSRKFACKSCRVFLKPAVEAAIVAVVLKTLPAVAVAATVGTTVQAVLGLSLIEELWKESVKILLGYADSPLDKLVHGVCKVARACVGDVSQTQTRPS